MKNLKAYASIGSVYKDNRIKFTVVNDAFLRRASPRRTRFSDKYDNGRVVVIGGSSFFYGAPSMALSSAHSTLAALRVGAGYVRTYVPGSILHDVRAFSPNMIVNSAGRDHIRFTEQIKDDISRTDVVVLGMGMGRDKESSKAAQSIIRRCCYRRTKLIVDADPIRLLGNDLHGSQILITPHDGEFNALFRLKPPSDELKLRLSMAVSAAKSSGMSILLKGHYTIATDGEETRLIKSKTAALATMGTGDVLAGIIAGYAATGSSLVDAAGAGAYLHSRIGDILFKEKGNHIIASDIIGNIPAVMKKFDKN